MRSKHSVPSKSQENFSPSNRSSATSSTQKHRGAAKASDSKRNLPHNPSEKGLKPKRQESADAGPSNRLRPAEYKQDEVEDLTSSELEQLEIQRTLLEQANSSTEKPPRSPSNDQAQLQQKPVKSKSDNDRSRDTGGLRMLPHNSKCPTSAAPTLTTANGQLDLKDPTVNKSGPNSVSTSSSIIDKGKGRGSDDTQRTFTKRPVQPIAQAESEPTGSLSRSKSQLTLLLEKDRSRGSGGPTSNGKKT